MANRPWIHLVERDTMAKAALTITFKSEDVTTLTALQGEATATRCTVTRILAGYVADKVTFRVVAAAYELEFGDYSAASVVLWIQGYAYAAKLNLSHDDTALTRAITCMTRTSAEQRNATPKMKNAQAFIKHVDALVIAHTAAKAVKPVVPASAPTTPVARPKDTVDPRPLNLPTVTAEANLAPVVNLATSLSFIRKNASAMSILQLRELAALAAEYATEEKMSIARLEAAKLAKELATV